MIQKIQGTFFPETYSVKQLPNSDTEGYTFELLSITQSARCVGCNTESSYGHGHQDRTVRDLPILGEKVTLLLAQKRYICGNKECRTDVFTERNDFVNPYYYFTERCRQFMLKVATLTSCESASKILAYQGISVSGDTLLRMLKAAGEAHETLVSTKIGVDDWAYRKGQEYGTIICDLDTHEIIDVLEGRDKETFENWLRGYPNIEVVSRDRASSYASAVRSVLPNAIQIADRFHITQNLLEALDETMKAFIPEVLEIPTTQTIPPEHTNSKVKKTRKRSKDRLRR